MLTTKKQFFFQFYSSGQEDIEPSELIFYHYLIIIGSQRYGFSFNWQKKLNLFSTNGLIDKKDRHFHASNGLFT